MPKTVKSRSKANNSNRTLPSTHETGFQPYLQETENQLMEEVKKLFQIGGIAMPAKVFSELLSTLTEHLGKGVNDSAFILERLCAMYDLYQKREYYLRVLSGDYSPCLEV